MVKYYLCFENETEYLDIYEMNDDSTIDMIIKSVKTASHKIKSNWKRSELTNNPSHVSKPPVELDINRQMKIEIEDQEGPKIMIIKQLQNHGKIIENGDHIFVPDGKYPKVLEYSKKEICVRFEDGSIYRGEHKNSMPNGFGTFKYLNGCEYVGYLKEATYDGYGHFKTAGLSLSGEFKNGKLIGRNQGVISYCVNQYYIGDIKKDENSPFNTSIKHGYGMLYENGDIYEGEFENDLKNGIGKCWNENEKYEGPFLKGKKNGVGTLINDDGVFTTLHKNNELVVYSRIYT